jgi:peroxiredoxin
MRKFLLPPLAVALIVATEPATPKAPEPGARVADFTAKDTNGKRQSLGDYRSKKAIVVFMIGTECPISNLYVVKLGEMQHEYAGKGVQFLAVNSNDHDSYDEVAAHAKERNLPFPVLKDVDHSVADALGATRTPEAFLLDPAGVIRYHGRIDDQYSFGNTNAMYRRPTPSKTELKDAIEEVLAGKAVSVPKSEFRGCLIGRPKKKAAQPSR